MRGVMFLPVSASVHLFTLIIQTNKKDTDGYPSTYRTWTQHRHSLSKKPQDLPSSLNFKWSISQFFCCWQAAIVIHCVLNLIKWGRIPYFCSLLAASLSDDILYSVICDCFKCTNWSFACPLCLFVLDGRAGQPAAQLLEQSLSADSTSVTLESLQPDTEYVISLYPLFPRNSASPSILNARTCKFLL